MAEREAPWLTAAAAACLPTIVFISVPNAIILRNLLDIPYNPTVVLAFVAAFIVSTGVLFLAFARFGAAAWEPVRLCFSAGACILLWGASAALTRSLTENLVLVMVVDSLVMIAAGIIISKLPLALLYRLSAAVALVLLFQNGIQHLLYLAEESNNTRDATVRETEAGPLPSHTGNVYHIMFDGFQKEAFAVLAEQDPTLLPEGWTFYPRFVANYAFTNFSVPQMLLGRNYVAGESFGAWSDAAKFDGLWARLQEAGMGVHLYPHFVEDCEAPSDNCNSTLDLRSGDFVSDTIDLWLIRLVPYSVELLLAGKWNPRTEQDRAYEAGGVSITAMLSRERQAIRRLPPNVNSPYAVLNFERMLAAEPDREGTGQYVFVHAIMPHYPQALNANCEIDTSESVLSLTGYMAQATCALNLIGRLVNTLQELDRYEDATIVVHSDHGMIFPTVAEFTKNYDEVLQHEPFAPLRNAAASPDENWAGGFALLWGASSQWWTSERVAARSGALLLTKLGKTRMEPWSSVPAQMFDVAPTILHHVGQEDGQSHGVPLQLAETGLDDRPVEFFAAWPVLNEPLPSGREFIRYVLTGDAWERMDSVPVEP